MATDKGTSLLAVTEATLGDAFEECCYTYSVHVHQKLAEVRKEGGEILKLVSSLGSIMTTYHGQVPIVTIAYSD